MKHPHEDPVLTSARREAIVVFGIWIVACTYTVGYCYAFGYDREVETLSYVAGMPDWVFYGVVLPWTVCTLLSFWVSNFLMRDENLGEEQAEVDVSGRQPDKEAGHA
jgi:hypothetical protein